MKGMICAYNGTTDKSGLDPCVHEWSVMRIWILKWMRRKTGGRRD